MNPRKTKTPLVAIVGRANVGKSTFWNKLSETSQAITSGKPHTTRDRNYATCLWRGKIINIVDTGGMDSEMDTTIGQGIRKQAEQAIKQANLVLFLVDSKTGVMPQDLEFAEFVRKTNPHFILIANKADKRANLGESISKELWQLRLGDPLTMSAISGRGVGDVLDEVYKKLEEIHKPPTEPETNESLKIVIMGRPNVGKSSIMNAILGEERSIVSPIAHTTREPLDTEFTWQDNRITLVDTAGMRKRAKVTDRIEHEAIERNRVALTRADIALLVIDATEDPRKQDKHLAGLLQDARKGLIVVVNKWDLVPDKSSNTSMEFTRNIRESLPFLNWAPVIFVSAKERKHIIEILKTAFKVEAERQRIISDNALSKLLKQIIAIQSPKAAQGTKAPYVTEVTQTATKPPTFEMTVRGKKITLLKSWIRFFENQLRKKFGFVGTPILVNVIYDKTPMAPLKGPQRRKKPIGRKGFRY
ncbi:ribosome biogenesis GTPase Der [Patescibacteria group bacterium]|nr:ribosome biogenesis GTPase Der [Patescibacteria group bacterium]